MGWRTVVVTKATKLDLKMGYMVVRTAESATRIHLSEITLLILETNNVSITAALMNELVQQKIKVVFCDEKKNPSFELTPFYGSHDCSDKIRRQIKWEDNKKKAIWTSIVAKKIENQAKTLQCFGLVENELLYSYLSEIEFNDATNREGHAAKVYFNALFGKSFSRGSECPVNAALNYGYALILSTINREIVSSGYLTQLGIFHDNMFNQFNLSCDLMEPFRPIVDRFVKANDFSKFEVEEKRNIQSILNQEFIIDDRIQNFMNVIKIYTKSVLDSIESGAASNIKFFRYEL